jgi:hypothetical protein
VDEMEITLHGTKGQELFVETAQVEMMRAPQRGLCDEPGAGAVLYFASGQCHFVRETVDQIRVLKLEKK